MIMYAYIYIYLCVIMKTSIFGPSSHPICLGSADLPWLMTGVVSHPWSLDLTAEISRFLIPTSPWDPNISEIPPLFGSLWPQAVAWNVRANASTISWCSRGSVSPTAQCPRRLSWRKGAGVVAGYQSRWHPLKNQFDQWPFQEPRKIGGTYHI